MKASLLVVGALAIAAPALADPCTTIPNDGPAPAFLRPGAVVEGPVVYVGDGDGLCVAIGPRTGRDWVELRLADFYAPELSDPGGRTAKSALERLTRGRRLRCDVGRQTYYRVVEACRVVDGPNAGRPLGQLLREAGVREGGRGWRR
jgi:endonuclease YncB( thermonuclease family)